ncbi:MAG: cyclic-phosphate processing receiver domain-containing protein [Nakamurella sp.]
MLPTQMNVLSRWPDAWRDAFLGRIRGCEFDVHVPGFEQPVKCWHHTDLSTALQTGEPVRIAGTLVRLAVGFVSVAATNQVPYRRPLPDGAFPPPATELVLTDVGTGRGLDERHLEPRDRLIVLIDDVRSFRDGRACRTARSEADGLALLNALRSLRIDELWLDHDLGSDRRTGRAFTVMPVVEALCAAAIGERPYNVGEIVIHTSNPVGAVSMRRNLEAAGFNVSRSTDPTLWRSTR